MRTLTTIYKAPHAKTESGIHCITINKRNILMHVITHDQHAYTHMHTPKPGTLPSKSQAMVVRRVYEHGVGMKRTERQNRFKIQRIPSSATGGS